MRIEDLSVNERILIHLKDFSTDPASQDVAMGQTQEGIGEAVGIRINHVPRATNALLENGYVGEALVHIGGLRRKRKAFFLTGKGMEMATGLISGLKGQKIPFRDSDGAENDRTIQDMLFGARRVTPSKLILAYFRNGVVLEAELTGKAESERISNLGAMPVPDNFVNREQEVGFIRQRLESGEKLTVVSGIKGIGKTSLVWKALKDFEGRKNIMWYSAHEWDTLRTVLESISDFYVRLGRNGLKKYLRMYKDAEVGQATAAFFGDIRGSDSVIVIDNIFGLKKEVMQFIHLACEQASVTDEFHMVLITRDRESLSGIPCLDRMESNDLTLRGLEQEGAMKLMASMGMEPEDSDRVFSMTQGHPLAIRLVNSEEIRKVIDTKGLTKEEVWVVRCMKAFEAILGD